MFRDGDLGSGISRHLPFFNPGPFLKHYSCLFGDFSSEDSTLVCEPNCATGTERVSGYMAGAEAEDLALVSCVDCPAGKSDADQNPATRCADCAAGRFSDAIGVVAECGGVCPVEYLSSHSPP